MFGVRFPPSKARGKLVVEHMNCRVAQFYTLDESSTVQLICAHVFGWEFVQILDWGHLINQKLLL